MLRVALTGGIASGKSTAAACFRDLGVPVIDTDRIARDITEPGMAGHLAMLTEFGPGILDEEGRLDRATLRQRIFSDATARNRVNAIMHPLILERLGTELAPLRAPYVVIEVPLLAETGTANEFDRVLVVDVPEAVQLARLAERYKGEPGDLKNALESQANRQERLRLADDVIDNTADIAALRNSVRKLHRKYLELATRFASAAPPRSE